ncbi:MAG: hypothetical protein MW689_001551 [Thermodesulfobacteria bacterium]|nr:O-antigen ligase family protein [Thermodesulfobacteriota bacterium]MCU4137980.1 hypothetical protein [Thermodesulfobacteriota bacterium]
MIPKVIILFLSTILIFLSTSPLTLIRAYLFFRPLVQPFANQHLTLFGSIPINAPLPLIVIFYSFLGCIFRKDFSIIVPKVIPLYLLLYWSMFSLYNTKFYLASIGFIFKILTAVSVYLFVYNAVHSVEDIKKLIKTICITCFVLIICGFYQVATKQGNIWYYGIVRMKSLFGSANPFGIFLSLCLIATLLMITIFDSKNKFYKFLFVMIIIASILGLNRGSWIAMSSALILGYFFFRNKIKFRYIIGPILIVFIIFSPIIILRFSEWSEVTPGNTFLARINMWKIILKLIPYHPFIGYGIGTADLLFQDLFGIRAWPHNDYLRLALEIGIGVIFYIYFLFSVLFLFLKNRYKNWKFNFCFVVLLLYWIIISIPQNIISNVINFPLFMALVACGVKYINLTATEDKKL